VEVLFYFVYVKLFVPFFGFELKWGAQGGHLVHFFQGDCQWLLPLNGTLNAIFANFELLNGRWLEVGGWCLAVILVPELANLWRSPLFRKLTPRSGPFGETSTWKNLKKTIGAALNVPEGLLSPPARKEKQSYHAFQNSLLCFLAGVHPNTARLLSNNLQGKLFNIKNAWQNTISGFVSFSKSRPYIYKIKNAFIKCIRRNFVYYVTYKAQDR